MFFVNLLVEIKNKTQTFKQIKYLKIMAFDIEMIKKVYDNMTERVDAARELVGRPLTLTEKILYSHLWSGKPSEVFQRGLNYVDFAPDRVTT